MNENPYTYIEPVTGEMFYDRSEEVDTLLKGFKSREGDSFAIIGGRGIGKTSLLREVERILIEELQADDSLLLVPVYVDLSYRVPHSKRSLFISATEALRECLAKSLPAFSLKPVDTTTLFDEKRSDDRAVEDFEGVIAQVIATSSQGIGNMRIVLLLDAVDQLLGTNWVSSLYPQIRALLSNRPVRRNLAMTMAGSINLFMTVQERGSPLMNVLRKRIFLRVFEKEAVKLLITQPLAAIERGDFLPSFLVDRVYALTGGHPFLIQYVMWNLCDLDIETVSEEDVNTVADRFHEERGDFDDWYGSLNKLDATVYASLLQSGESLSKRDILTKYISDFYGVPDALKILLSTGVIRETDVADTVKYAPAGEMFEQWFSEHYLRVYERFLSPPRVH